MQEIFGYDGKLVIIAGISILTWIFLVAGTATPFASDGSSTATLFEACINSGSYHKCEHTYGCTALDSTVRGGAAFAVMSILAWCAVCAITIGRIFKPAFFDRPQLPMILYVSYGVIAFMLLIAWACAFGAAHKGCNGGPSLSTLGWSVGPCGWLLLFAQIFIGIQAGIEWKMPNGKSASDNYNAVGAQGGATQHVSVAGDTTGGDNQYAASNNNNAGGNATGYSDVSEQ